MNNPREKLLEVAFNEIYQNGYTATSIDKILKQASMNKGSMYHFFKSKKELGLAVVNEKINSYIEDKYSVLLKFEKNICEELLKLIKDRRNFDFTCGCKLNNLMQELSPIDEDFKVALEKVYIRFENIIEEVLNKAVKNGSHKIEYLSHEETIIVISLKTGALAKEFKLTVKQNIMVINFNLILNKILSITCCIAWQNC